MTIKEVRNRKGLLFSENGEIIGLKQIYVAFGVVVVIDENCIVKAKHLTSETTKTISISVSSMKMPIGTKLSIV